MRDAYEGSYEDSLIQVVKPLYDDSDPAHDFSHILRVYKNCKIIGIEEDADMQVLLLAALLHDVRSDKKRWREPARSDTENMEVAREFMNSHGIRDIVKEKVEYAISVHSFKKGIMPDTLEAKILQDADRLDAIGAIGIARVFMFGGTAGRKLYDFDDPFCNARVPDDLKWNIDHFYTKLLNLADGMHTNTGKRLAKVRNKILLRYLEDLKDEII